MILLTLKKANNVFLENLVVKEIKYDRIRQNVTNTNMYTKNTDWNRKGGSGLEIKEPERNYKLKRQEESTKDLSFTSIDVMLLNSFMNKVMNEVEWGRV